MFVQDYGARLLYLDNFEASNPVIKAWPEWYLLEYQD